MLDLIFTAALISVASIQACKYSCICANHTMCKYPTDGFGANCPSPNCADVNTIQQQQILYVHNYLRGRVAQGLETVGAPGPQPSASNMRQFTWDEELATIAQRWANQCTFQHDTCRSVARFYVGQNLYMTSSLGITPNCGQDWTSAVLAWYNEVKDFNNSKINPFQFTSNTGHYTQLAWANTYKVGCGFAAFNGSNERYNKFYACNYGPGGNIRGGSMYTVGDACTACSGACNDGLCV